MLKLVPLGTAGDQAFEHVGQPGEWIDAVQLCCSDQGHCDSPMPGSAIRSGEQSVFPSHRHTLHAALDNIGIYLQPPVIEEQYQAGPVPQRVADGVRQRRRVRARAPVWLSARSATSRRSDGCAAGGRHGGARAAGRGSRPRSHRAWRSGRVPQRRAAIWSLRGSRRSDACNGPNRKPARSCRVSPGRGTRCSHDLQLAAEAGEMFGGMLALAVWAVDVGGGRMPRAFPGSRIDRVAPQPSGLGLATTGIEHREGGVISKDHRRRQYDRERQVIERAQPPAGPTHPVTQRRAVDRDALALQHLGLAAMQRQEVAELAAQHMHQQRFSCHAAINRPLWRKRLHDGIPAGAHP